MAQIDKDKFTDLIKENKIAMYRLAYGIVRSKEDAEDAVGEAVMKAYEHLDALRDIKKFKQWIMQITANEAKKIYGRLRRVEFVEDVEVWGASHSDIHNELWDIVITLDEKYRAVIILFYYDQMKIKEIGKVLHITEGTVKSRLSRAKGRLKELI